MNHSPTIEKPAIDLEVKEKIKEDMALEGQVTIHIDFTAKIEGSLLRIWKTTFLFSKNSAHKSKLLQHFNISLYPQWMLVNLGETIRFTLIFSALPKSCTHFDLIEQIPQAGGFAFRNIVRNSTDVYHLILQ